MSTIILLIALTVLNMYKNFLVGNDVIYYIVLTLPFFSISYKNKSHSEVFFHVCLLLASFTLIQMYSPINLIAYLGIVCIANYLSSRRSSRKKIILSLISVLISYMTLLLRSENINLVFPVNYLILIIFIVMILITNQRFYNQLTFAALTTVTPHVYNTFSIEILIIISLVFLGMALVKINVDFTKLFYLACIFLMSENSTYELIALYLVYYAHTMISQIDAKEKIRLILFFVALLNVIPQKSYIVMALLFMYGCLAYWRESEVEEISNVY